MRTRLLRFVPALLLLLALLAGCGSMPEQSASNEGSDQATQASGSPSDSAQEARGDDALTEQNRFLHSMEQRAVRIGDVLYFTDCGANHMPMILAVDLKTMECFPLCGKPECEHKNSSCGAYAGNAGPVSLTASQGKLYYLDTVFAPITSAVCRMEPDGSGRTEITRLHRDPESTSDRKSYSWFGIYADKVYRVFCGDYMEDADPHETAVFYSQPLEADSEDRVEELLRVENAVGAAACIDGHDLYLCVSTVQDQENRFSVYAYDMDAETMETLYSGLGPCVPSTIARVEDELLFGYGAPAFQLSLSDHSLAELPISTNHDDVVMIGPNVVFIHSSPYECRCVDYSGKLLYEGFYVPDELRDADLTCLPIGFTDGCFFFLMESYTEESAIYHMTAFRPEDHSAKLLYSMTVQNGNLFGD